MNSDITAAEAKDLTKKALNAKTTEDTRLVKIHLREIHTSIRAAAEKGHSQVDINMNMASPNGRLNKEQNKAITEILEEEGYKVEWVTQRHIGGSSQLTVKWS